jgi:hypothetical protein
VVAAVRDALYVPTADGRVPGAEHAEETLLATRAALLRGVLGNFLATGAPAQDIDVTAQTVRAVTEDTPVTYPVSQRAKAAS